MAVLKFKDVMGNWHSIPAIQGADGDTPVRGTDYWTAEDIAAIEAYCEDYIDSEILGGTS